MPISSLVMVACCILPWISTAVDLVFSSVAMSSWLSRMLPWGWGRGWGVEERKKRPSQPPSQRAGNRPPPGRARLARARTLVPLPLPHPLPTPHAPFTHQEHHEQVPEEAEGPRRVDEVPGQPRGDVHQIGPGDPEEARRQHLGVFELDLCARGLGGVGGVGGRAGGGPGDEREAQRGGEKAAPCGPGRPAGVPPVRRPPSRSRSLPATPRATLGP